MCNVAVLVTIYLEAADLQHNASVAPKLVRDMSHISCFGVSKNGPYSAAKPVNRTRRQKSAVHGQKLRRIAKYFGCIVPINDMLTILSTQFR